MLKYYVNSIKNIKKPPESGFYYENRYQILKKMP